jgi:hypothetical protein
MNFTTKFDPVENILNRLQGVIQKTPDSSVAICPSHADSNPSLSIARGDDGRALVKCWAGCTAAEIVEAMGLTLADLFERPHDHYKPGRKRIKPDYKALLELLSFESMAIIICCQPATRGEQLTKIERESLARAVANIQRVRVATL